MSPKPRLTPPCCTSWPASGLAGVVVARSGVVVAAKSVLLGANVRCGAKVARNGRRCCGSATACCSPGPGCRRRGDAAGATVAAGLHLRGGHVCLNAGVLDGAVGASMKACAETGAAEQVENPVDTGSFLCLSSGVLFCCGGRRLVRRTGDNVMEPDDAVETGSKPIPTECTPGVGGIPIRGLGGGLGQTPATAQLPSGQHVYTAQRPIRAGARRY